MFDVLPLFSVPLYISRTGRKITQVEQEVFDSLPMIQLPGGNYNSDSTSVLEIPELKELKQFCEHHLYEYSKTLLRIKEQFYITNSWTTKNPMGTRHLGHKHPNSIFSGVYYMKTSGSKIRFEGKPQFLQELQFDYSFEEGNIWNCYTWYEDVNEGDVIMFPSWVYHSVPPNPHNETRMILGFNSFLSGIVGNDQNLTKLVL